MKGQRSRVSRFYDGETHGHSSVKVSPYPMVIRANVWSGRVLRGYCRAATCGRDATRHNGRYTGRYTGRHTGGYTGGEIGEYTGEIGEDEHLEDRGVLCLGIPAYSCFAYLESAPESTPGSAPDSAP